MENRPHLPVPLGHKELLIEMERAGVACAILIPPSLDLDRNDPCHDFSRLPRGCSYGQAVTMFTEELDFLSPTELDGIMGRGVAECLNWRRR